MTTQIFSTSAAAIAAAKTFMADLEEFSHGGSWDYPVTSKAEGGMPLFVLETTLYPAGYAEFPQADGIDWSEWEESREVSVVQETKNGRQAVYRATKWGRQETGFQEIEMEPEAPIEDTPEGKFQTPASEWFPRNFETRWDGTITNGWKVTAHIRDRENQTFPIAYEEMDTGPYIVDRHPRCTFAHYHPLAVGVQPTVNLLG